MTKNRLIILLTCVILLIAAIVVIFGYASFVRKPERTSVTATKTSMTTTKTSVAPESTRMTATKTSVAPESTSVDPAKTVFYFNESQGGCSTSLKEPAYTDCKVNQLYLTVLGRLAYDADKVFYLAESNKGLSYASIRSKLAYGPEATQTITKLYGGCLLRTPDDGGMTFWKEQLNSSNDMAWVASRFAISPEAKGKGYPCTVRSNIGLQAPGTATP